MSVPASPTGGDRAAPTGRATDAGSVADRADDPGPATGSGEDEGRARSDEGEGNGKDHRSAGRNQ